MNCTQCGVEIDYRSATGLCLEHFREAGGKHKPMPADFPTYSVHKGWRELCPHYGISRSTLTVWRREASIAAGKRVPWSEQDDGILRANYGSASYDAIGAQLERSPHAVKARAKLLGLIKPSAGLFIRRETQTRISHGHSGEAAYLQAYGPIYRCHKDGTPAPIGACWYWAGQVLSHDEMEAKARAHRERKALLAA